MTPEEVASLQEFERGREISREIYNTLETELLERPNSARMTHEWFEFIKALPAFDFQLWRYQGYLVLSENGYAYSFHYDSEDDVAAVFNAAVKADVLAAMEAREAGEAVPPPDPTEVEVGRAWLAMSPYRIWKMAQHVEGAVAQAAASATLAQLVVGRKAHFNAYQHAWEALSEYVMEWYEVGRKRAL